jgi:hypothetical protein
MFLDVDSRCKVVTPAHVVKLIDGRVVSTIHIRDDRKREFTTGPPELLSDQLDVAILVIKGAGSASICGSDRLSQIGVARRVASMQDAILETTGEGEIVKVPVRARAARIDQEQGTLFSVQPTIAKDLVVKGWSGSIIVDEEGPLGMVVQVDDERNEAIAVRADAIRQLIDSTLPSTVTASAVSPNIPTIILTAGSTADTDSNSQQMFASGGPGWIVVPKDHRIVFIVLRETPIRLQGVRLRVRSKADSIAGMDIAVSPAADRDEWESLKYCLGAAGAETLTCSVLGSTVSVFRVSLKTTTEAPLALSDFTFE